MPYPNNFFAQSLLDALNSFHGIKHRGNIDLSHRPSVQNPDGSHSSVYSMTFTLPGGRAVLVPGVIRNERGQWFRVSDPNQAWVAYKRTGQHFGIFKNEAAANRYADLLHRQQAALGG